MNITLRTEVQKFIEEQVRTGGFASPSELLESAIDRMMAESEQEFDDATVAAINRAEAQLDRGEGIEFDQFAAELRKKLASK